MKVSVQPAEGLQQTITVTVPNKDITLEVEKKLAETAAQARLPGFRPGKVPLNVVKKRFGAAVRNDVNADVINKTYFKAVEQEKLKPVSMPEINIVNDNADSDLEYTAKFDILPEITVQGLDQIKVERVTAEVTDADLDDMLDVLRNQHVDFEPADRAAQSGDRVTIDFDGFIDGKPFEGGQAQDFDLVLGSNSMIAGFESGIESLKAGDEKTLKLSFPDNYHAKGLAGQPVEFNVVVKSVHAAVVPELDEKFANKFNVDTLAKLKKEIRGNMERELTMNLKNKVKSQVLDGLLAHNAIEVPTSLLKNEIDALRQQTLSRVGNGKNSQLPQLPDTMFEEQAMRRVRLGLLMGNIIEKEAIKADQDRINKMIDQFASVYEDAEAIRRQYQANPQQMSEIEQVVIEEQVVDKILESTQVTEIQKTFTEIMNPAKAQADEQDAEQTKKSKATTQAKTDTKKASTAKTTQPAAKKTSTAKTAQPATKKAASKTANTDAQVETKKAAPKKAPAKKT